MSSKLTNISEKLAKYVDDSLDEEIIMNYISSSINNVRIRQVLNIYGLGANGKSTFLRFLHEVIPQSKFQENGLVFPNGNSIIASNVPLLKGSIGVEFRKVFLR